MGENVTAGLTYLGPSKYKNSIRTFTETTQLLNSQRERERDRGKDFKAKTILKFQAVGQMTSPLDGSHHAFWLAVITPDLGWPKTEQYPDGGKVTSGFLFYCLILSHW